MPEPTAGVRPMRVLRANAAWILAATLAATLGAWIVSGMIKPKYVSTASVVLEPRVTANTTPVSPAMGTEKQLVSSGVVLDRAAASLGLTAEELEKHLDVAVPPDANVLNISCHFGDPVRAQRCADRVATNYVTYRGVAGSEAADPASSSGASSGGAIKATVVTRATLPSHAENNPRGVTLGLGLVLGILLGLGAAFVRELLSNRFHGFDDLGARTGLPVAGLIPDSPRLRGRVEPGLVVVTAPGSAMAEGYRHLRARISARLGAGAGSAAGSGAGSGAGSEAGSEAGGHGGAERSVLLVTSAAAGEGRSTVGANLAITMARSGLRVILVDADSLDPTQAHRFSVPRGLGLPELLAGTASVDQAARPTAVPGLRVVAGGRGIELADRLLTRQNLGRVVAELRLAADVVVIDTAPVLQAAEVVALAPLCDAVLLVVHAGRSTRDRTVAAAHQVTDAGVPVFTVATAAPSWWGAAAPTRGRAGGQGQPPARSGRPAGTEAWTSELPTGAGTADRVFGPATGGAAPRHANPAGGSPASGEPSGRQPSPPVPAPAGPSSKRSGAPSTAPIPLGRSAGKPGAPGSDGEG